MYKNIADLVKLANDKNVALWEIVLENEMKLSGLCEETIMEKVSERYDVMCQSSTKALSGGLPTAKTYIEGCAKKHYDYTLKDDTISGPLVNKLMSMALSGSEVNSSMGKICAAPTAGACGVLPSVLSTVGERYNLTRDEILKGLLTASGIGAVIQKNATVAGSEAGCQAECGAAASMAAAAAVQMAGGTNEMCVQASSLALINCMGLICDPLAGLVQIPCAQRNASQAVNAILSADLALAGMEIIITTDEVIETMLKVGRMMPHQLKETALGGIAATQTGKVIMKEFLKDSKF